MRWIYYNPNPKGKNTDDCVIRALSKALDNDWDTTKLLVDVFSMDMKEVETSDLVWGRILSENNFTMKASYCHKNECNLESFCETHSKGTYVVKVNGHVVCVKDGYFYDSWDSGQEIPLYYWERD